MVKQGQRDADFIAGVPFLFNYMASSVVSTVLLTDE